ncbi:hypothetical protein L210DRAFT_3646652 [Boletus edulis BED1]|uniref:Uncharacterized protein n=1 Tax=Boletus edulis BED1 TaxID=1328754 RepID=A0AAD4BRU2_BOLED|nr:hypothetical protein L210DRAFT_3646652 [Boletus edulis BED1]
MRALSSLINESILPGRPAFKATDIPDMTGKVVLVTGGTAGIGKRLLECQCIIVNKSIKGAAEEFNSKETQLNVLFNNAGVMVPPIDMLTYDGYDLQHETPTRTVSHRALKIFLRLTLSCWSATQYSRFSKSSQRSKDVYAIRYSVRWLAEDPCERAFKIYRQSPPSLYVLDPILGHRPTLPTFIPPIGAVAGMNATFTLFIPTTSPTGTPHTALLPPKNHLRPLQPPHPPRRPLEMPLHGCPARSGQFS